MPEAPDLQVIKEFLQSAVTGVAIAEARVLRPIVLRSLAVSAPEFPNDVAGRGFEGIWRQGKFLGLELSEKQGVNQRRLLVINPMLNGGLRYCDSKERVTRKTSLVFTLDDGHELHYFDDDQMGMVYYLTPGQLSLVPRLNDQGPDVLEAPLNLEEFKARLRRFRGELKGVLTRGAFVSGIGNAYADEVLFSAGFYPFRKAGSLKGPELARLHAATYAVVGDAVSILRERVGPDIHVKVRDFLRVHGKGGTPCPACGTAIASITANRFLTNYCRRCQPGSLFGGPAMSGKDRESVHS